ncbi:MAG: hypothetical protein KAS57_08435, partial [Gammaproteobacteria bacterium]|nr:hypothetical protein [Gammaproteobacteria bacterium]
QIRPTLIKVLNYQHFCPNRTPVVSDQKETTAHHLSVIASGKPPYTFHYREVIRAHLASVIELKTVFQKIHESTRPRTQSLIPENAH